MTTKIRLVLAAIITTGLVAFAGLCHGQTTNTNSITTNSPVSALPGGITQLGGDVLAYFTDAQPYFTNGLRLGAYGLYGLRNPATPGNLNPKRGYGGFFDLSVPTPAGPQLSLDFALGGLYDGHNLSVYDAAVAPQIGTTWNLPVIGHVYSWAEAGPGYSFQAHTAILHSAEGFSKSFKLFGLNWAGTLGALQMSDHTGTGWFGGLSIGK